MTDADQRPDTNWTILFLCWLLVAGSTLGSLFFSEIMDLAPCSLCWTQRIFMFPLAIILLIGLFPFDRKIVKYALPLAIGGWLVAFYHTLLYAGIIPRSIQPCGKGASCSEVYIELFGFLSIPMLSLIAFSVLAALLFVLKRRLS